VTLPDLSSMDCAGDISYWIDISIRCFAVSRDSVYSVASISGEYDLSLFASVTSAGFHKISHHIYAA
jgi:hypothetical protein